MGTQGHVDDLQDLMTKGQELDLDVYITAPKPDKRGFYRCPYRCGDPRFPRRKWRTEKGILKHLGECPLRPEAVAARKVEEERQEVERKARAAEKIAACTRKVGDIIFFVKKIVVEPTHVRRGNRMVRVRYEEKCRFEADKGTIQQILHDGRHDGWPAWYAIGFGIVTEDQVKPTWEEAVEAAKARQKGHEEWLETCAMCR